jgi:DeoR/GlpR family transcriptional regulator of sugar metabolism
MADEIERLRAFLFRASDMANPEGEYDRETVDYFSALDQILNCPGLIRSGNSATEPEIINALRNCTSSSKLSHQLDRLSCLIVSRSEELSVFLRSLFRSAVPPSQASGFTESVTSSSPRVLAYHGQKSTFSAPSLVTCILTEETARVKPLIESSQYRIDIALVQGLDCSALLLEISNTHYVIALSQAVPLSQSIRHFEHEVRHLANYLKGDHGHTFEFPSEHIAGVETHFDSFAARQLTIDRDLKRTVARWVASELCPPPNSGVVLDSGSACFYMWESLFQGIKSGRSTYYNIVTNNISIIRHWAFNCSTSDTRNSLIRTFGNRIDTEDLAFYGGSYEALVDVVFRPSHVFIGVMGFDVDREGIYIGYNGTEEELHVKELLFRKRAPYKIILGAPSKVGCAGGRALNLSNLNAVWSDTKVFFVTTEPEPETDEEKAFRHVFGVFESDSVQASLAEKGISISWITVGRDTKGSLQLIPELSCRAGDS